MVLSSSHVKHSWECWECSEPLKPSSIWPAKSKQGRCSLCLSLSRSLTHTHTLSPAQTGAHNKLSGYTLILSFIVDMSLVDCCHDIGIFTDWRILWITCQFPCKRWVRLQVLGRTGGATWQTEPSGTLRTNSMQSFAIKIFIWII